MNLIFDPPKSLYLALIIAAIISAAFCANYQSRRSLIGLLITALLLLGLYLIDTFVESPREAASRRVLSMAAAATESSPKRFLENVSDSFQASGKTKGDLEASPAWALIRQFNARIKISGLDRDDSRMHGDDEIEIGFMAKAEAQDGGMVLRYVRAGFVREGDTWRMKSIRFYSPISIEKLVEEPIPGFP